MPYWWARYRRVNRTVHSEKSPEFRDWPSSEPALISNCLSGGATLVGPDRPTGKEEVHDIKSHSPKSDLAVWYLGK